MTSTDNDMLHLDLRGLKCPFPVLRTRKAIQALPSGGVLVAIADDPAAAIDFPHYCQEAGHTLAEQTSEGAELTFKIIKK